MTIQHQRNNKGNERMVEENTESSFDNHNAKSNRTKEVDKLSDSPDSQQFTYGCNVSADVMLPKYKKAEVNHGCAGLLNSGNACFANSVLQYLHCIPELKAALLRFDLRNTVIWIVNFLSVHHTLIFPLGI